MYTEHSLALTEIGLSSYKKLKIFSSVQKVRSGLFVLGHHENIYTYINMQAAINSNIQAP